MKKKLLTVLLTACLLLAGLAGLGGDAGALNYGMDAFAPIRAYDGHFTDVKQGDWFYGSVASLYELGLTEGQSATGFGAGSSVSLAEAVSFAARIHSTYYFGSPSFGPALFDGAGGDWYGPCVAYLQSSGVIDGSFDGSWRRAATRAETAYILSRVLPGYELGELNYDAVDAGYGSGRYITDVRSSTPYAEEILTLYIAGVVTGSDDSGSFLPYSEITRAELAAMLTRVVYPEKRVSLGWDGSAPSEPEPIRPGSEPAVTGYPELVFEQGRYIPSHSVDDDQAILSNVRWLFRNGQTELKLNLDSYAARPAEINRLLDSYITASQLYLEQGYTSVSCQYDRQGSMTLSFSNPNGGDRDAALEKAVELHDRFHADGTVTDGMTEIEIARVYAKYLCDTCEYDYNSQRVSHTAYGALLKGSAVCEGYTAAYNILLKLEGINASTAQAPNHIWTTATLDGILYHIDVTWCDQSYGFESLYFCMTPEFSMNRSIY
ncbi:MAG: S-layer homology domain-containing protein [Butyricicoccus sp.]|nr:S-layer homology domain-containing protein [Butyricicoccus sp.]